MASSSQKASSSGSPAVQQPALNQLVIPGPPPTGATYDWLRDNIQKFACFISEQMPATIAHQQQEIVELNEKLRRAEAEIEQKSAALTDMHAQQANADEEMKKKDAAMENIWETYLANSAELEELKKTLQDKVKALTNSDEENKKLKDQLKEHKSTITELKDSIRKAANVKPTPETAPIVSKVEVPSSISIPSAVKLDPAQLAALCDPSPSVKREPMSPRAQERPRREEAERHRGNRQESHQESRRDSHQDSYRDNYHPHPSRYYGSAHAQTHRSNGYQSGRGSYSNNGYRRGFNRPY